MKKILLLFLPLLMLGCSYESDLEDENAALRHKIDSLTHVIASLEKPNDTLLVYLDSVFNMEVNLPKVFKPSEYDSTTVRTFNTLATKTNGKATLLASSKLIKKEIVRIIEHNASDDADLLFLIDKTGSMQDDIDNIRKGLSQIIGSLSKFRNVRLAFALYGDKNVDGSQWFSYRNFEIDHEKAQKFIDTIQVTGGDDYPESVYDGFFEAQKRRFWKSTKKRMIVLIGDAPSLEKPLSDHTLEDVIKTATENGLKMNFYPIIVSPSEVPAEYIKGYKPKSLVSSVYPNPSQGRFRTIVKSNDVTRYELYSSGAVKIGAGEVSGQEFELDLGSQGNGLYVLRVFDKDNNYDDKKVVIAK
jgi:hypothetical protein